MTLVFYGIYFGVMGRDCAELCVDYIAASVTVSWCVMEKRCEREREREVGKEEGEEEEKEEVDRARREKDRLKLYV